MFIRLTLANADDHFKQKDDVSPWNGGTTAGNLVFQGTADGRFVACNAKTGEKLWESSTGTGVTASLKDIVLTPLRLTRHAGKLSEDDVVKIQAFVQGTADAIRPKR
jgi:hypothetical protein